MLVKMKYLSIEEMHIQHIHSKTRTQFCVASIWRMLILFLRHVLPQ